MQEYKIKIPDKEISRQVQEKAFELGYDWNFNEGKHKIVGSAEFLPNYLVKALTLNSNGNMYRTDYFDESHYSEISYQDFLNINNIMPEQKEITLRLAKQPAKAKNLTVGNEYTGIYTDAENTQVDDIKDAKYFFCVNNNHGEARYAINLFEQIGRAHV